MKGVKRRRRNHTTRKSKRRTARSVAKLRLLELVLRAALWAALVFLLIPYGFERFGPGLLLFSMNANVANLFVLALLAVFAILRWKALLQRPLGWTYPQLGFMIPAALFFWASFTGTYRAIIGATALTKALYLVVPPFTYAVASLFLALAIFGWPLLSREGRTLAIGAIIGIPYVACSLLVREAWPILSSLVMKANVLLLGLTGGIAAVTTNAIPMLSFENFVVVIGEACSGVDSAIMFTGVYLFVALLDWNRLDTKKLTWLFPIGLVGMFCVNILRVALLMMIGAYYSPQFALSMFHENAGWILFVAYTLGFWYLVYPKVRR